MPDFTLAFNPSYLRDAATLPVQPEPAVFGFTDTLKPAGVSQPRHLPVYDGKMVVDWTPAGERLRLVMPVRV